MYAAIIVSFLVVLIAVFGFVYFFRSSKRSSTEDVNSENKKLDIEALSKERDYVEQVNPGTSDIGRDAWRNGYRAGKEFMENLNEDGKLFIEFSNYYNVSKTEKPVSNIAVVISKSFDNYLSDMPEDVSEIFQKKLSLYELNNCQDLFYQGALFCIEKEVEKIKGEKMKL